MGTPSIPKEAEGVRLGQGLTLALPGGAFGVTFPRARPRRGECRNGGGSGVQWCRYKVAEAGLLKTHLVWVS